MNYKTHRTSLRLPPRRQSGLTLIELAVTMVIALFLLAGVLMMVQNTRTTYSNQTELAQLQDNERLAMTIMTDVIQSSGYFPDPTKNDAASAFPADTTFGKVGQAVFGAQSGSTPQDSIAVRFRTSHLPAGVGDGILNCLGTSNTTGADHTYVNAFDLGAADASGNRALECTLSTDGVAAAPQTLVGGIQDMQIYYGVKRTTTNDFNVDTYLRAGDMQPTDWVNVTSVRLILTFANPVAPGTGPAAPIKFERVIAVMNRAGVMT